jgi:hypothetical protein
MKKLKGTGLLSINKETIAKLNGEKMDAIHGGATGLSVNCSLNTCAVSVCLMCHQPTAAACVPTTAH